MSDDVAELKLPLEKTFSVATKLYQSRGFQHRIGFGRKLVLVNVDLANVTRPHRLVHFLCWSKRLLRKGRCGPSLLAMVLF